MDARGRPFAFAALPRTLKRLLRERVVGDVGVDHWGYLVEWSAYRAGFGDKQITAQIRTNNENVSTSAVEAHAQAEGLVDEHDGAVADDIRLREEGEDGPCSPG